LPNEVKAELMSKKMTSGEYQLNYYKLTLNMGI